MIRWNFEYPFDQLILRASSAPFKVDCCNFCSGFVQRLQIVKTEILCNITPFLFLSAVHFPVLCFYFVMSSLFGFGGEREQRHSFRWYFPQTRKHLIFP